MRGLGCMRLTEHDEARGVATIHAALDAGVTLLDTADVYFGPKGAVGDNERLVARAVGTWSGDRNTLVVATKGGLRRTGGRWQPDGRAKHLRAACEKSAQALGVERIDLYQLHAIDPRTRLATSVRALARLQRDGLVRDIGLCNVTLGQLREASDLAPIAAVQVALNPFQDDALRNGVAEHCAAHGIRLIAHSPLGGPKKAPRLSGDPALAELAQRLACTPAALVLAWLMSLGDTIVPIPGATRPQTAAAVLPRLDAETLRVLDARFPASVVLRVPRARRQPAAHADGEVVLLMGFPGAGKSTAARAYVERGYARLNRDEAGGRLKDLLPALEEQLAAGERRVVLDNTYATRASRNAVVETAWRHGVPVRCAWLQTSLEDAQVNAVQRMLARHGRLLEPEEIDEARRRDPNTFAPDAQFRYRRELEPPDLDEGFVAIDTIAFERRRASGDARALVLEHDLVTPENRDTIASYHDKGWQLLGLAWLPGWTQTAAREHVAELQSAVGLDFEFLTCLHEAGPPKCWCRKPLPGRGVVFIERHGLDPGRCLHVGRNPTDRLFAERLGFAYADADAWARQAL